MHVNVHVYLSLRCHWLSCLQSPAASSGPRSQHLWRPRSAAAPRSGSVEQRRNQSQSPREPGATGSGPPSPPLPPPGASGLSLSPFLFSASSQTDSSVLPAPPLCSSAAPLLQPNPVTHTRTQTETWSNIRVTGNNGPSGLRDRTNRTPDPAQHRQPQSRGSLG